MHLMNSSVTLSQRGVPFRKRHLIPGGCGCRIAGHTPSPGGNLPSDRYLTHDILLPAALNLKPIIPMFSKNATGCERFFLNKQKLSL